MRFVHPEILWFILLLPLLALLIPLDVIDGADGAAFEQAQGAFPTQEEAFKAGNHAPVVVVHIADLAVQPQEHLAVYRNEHRALQDKRKPAFQID